MSKYKLAGLLLLLAILVYFPVFLHLTEPSIRIYDEARLALNAYQMAHSGNWIVTHYDGPPDMWNTKPPLMIWLQAIGLKVFGTGEFAIRFPAAMAAVFTCAVIFLFCYRFIKKPGMGFSAIMVLITSSGYISTHVTRTGDYDSLLTLLTTTYLLCFFVFTETEGKQSNRFLLLFFIGATLAVLCKGVAGIMFAPALLIYAFVRGKVLKTMQNRNFILGAILFLVIGVGYYFLRELFNPGYLKAVWENELGGRYMGAIEGHVGSPWYYYDGLVEKHFNYWYLLIPCGIATGIASLNRRISNFTVFIAIAAVQFFLTISWGQTKLLWYDAPLFPLMSILAAVFINQVFEILNNNEMFKVNLKYAVLSFVFLFMVFIKPYCEIVEDQYKFTEEDWAVNIDRIPMYLKNVDTYHANVDGCGILTEVWPSAILFYQKVLAEKGEHIYIAYLDKLKVNDKLIIAEDGVYARVSQQFNTALLRDEGGVKTYKLISHK